jgi:hypothetical protein
VQPVVVHDPYGFAIDLAQAKALRDDLERERRIPSQPHRIDYIDYYHKEFAAGRLTREQFREAFFREAFLRRRPPVPEARREVRAQIEEKKRALPECPATYGRFEARRDRWRLAKLQKKSNAPPHKLTGEEDAEEALLIVRLTIFEQTPAELEGERIRTRIDELRWLREPFISPTLLTEAEEIEYDSLMSVLTSRYPALPPDPEDPDYGKDKSSAWAVVESWAMEYEQQKRTGAEFKEYVEVPPYCRLVPGHPPELTFEPPSDASTDKSEPTQR